MLLTFKKDYPMTKLTKAQALADFKETYMPLIRQQEADWGNGVDSCLRTEEWNNYTDHLAKDRQITQHQYNTWTSPF